MLQLSDDEDNGFDSEPTDVSLALPRARILVVDDEPVSRDAIVTKLRLDGYDVYVARSGDEALVMLATMRCDGSPTGDVDLLVLNPHMHGRCGVNVLRELRSEQSTIPALFIADGPDPGLFTIAALLGARVMLKPIDLDRLGDAAIKLILARPPSLLWATLETPRSRT